MPVGQGGLLLWGLSREWLFLDPGCPHRVLRGASWSDGDFLLGLPRHGHLRGADSAALSRAHISLRVHRGDDVVCGVAVDGNDKPRCPGGCGAEVECRRRRTGNGHGRTQETPVTANKPVGRALCGRRIGVVPRHGRDGRNCPAREGTSEGERGDACQKGVALTMRVPSRDPDLLSEKFPGGNHSGRGCAVVVHAVVPDS